MLNKKEFAKRLSEKGYTVKDSMMIIEDFLNTIEDALIEGEAVMFHGFGTFSTFERAERKSTDVRTHEPITVPSFISPKFAPGKGLKRAVREGIARR